MKATIEVTVKRKFKINIRNHADAERIRSQFQKHYEEERNFDRPLYVDGELSIPDTEVGSGVSFVDLNW